MNGSKVLALCLLISLVPIGACESKGNAHEVSGIPSNQPSESPSLQNVSGKEIFGYWPSAIELKGKLVKRSFWGPPNFGENPATDTKEQSWILILDAPIDVRSTTEDDPILGPSVANVQELQLVLRTPLKDVIGNRALVTGTLFHAHTGHHHTDVLLDVGSIRKVD